jgi:hypothetical protein
LDHAGGEVVCHRDELRGRARGGHHRRFDRRSLRPRLIARIAHRRGVAWIVHDGIVFTAECAESPGYIGKFSLALGTFLRENHDWPWLRPALFHEMADQCSGLFRVTRANTLIAAYRVGPGGVDERRLPLPWRVSQSSLPRVTAATWRSGY